ncbi:hypothetical protein GGR79_002257 [Xanthomonas arboricola]|nr:hypothetical protein [Xanthomonas arboricola]
MLRVPLPGYSVSGDLNRELFPIEINASLGLARVIRAFRELVGIRGPLRWLGLDYAMSSLALP